MSVGSGWVLSLGSKRLNMGLKLLRGAAIVNPE